MFAERLLGFDARELWVDPAVLWDEARRSTYLLRVDAPRPLSVDKLVWPSVFGEYIVLPAHIREHLRPGGVPLPDWTGPNAGLWSDLPAMRRYLAAHWRSPRAHAVIAVTWLSDRQFMEAGQFGPYLVPAERSALDPAWQLLGFDVADGSRISGLSNCGYTPGEVQRLRSAWAPFLSESHLFADAARALEFRDLSDARVSEHAPFVVYGLLLVQEARPLRGSSFHRGLAYCSRAAQDGR